MRRRLNFAKILGAIFVASGLMVGGKALALTFSQDIGVSFTFNPTISISLSAADLVIGSLAPGTVADSNVITVNVLTNTANGYTLNASVGNNSTYNTRNLIHQDAGVSNVFASVDFGTSIVNNTGLSDNTWAYAYLDESLNNGTNTTWSNYSGLPLYSDTTNVATIKTSVNPATSQNGDSVKFKIAARASETQAAGKYNNVVNFAVVAAPVPITLSEAYANAGKTKEKGYYKLQDMNADICAAAEVLNEGSQMQAIDVRDNKVYWITKLRDGKCWMTQNLDLDLDATKTYTHADTDLGWGSDTATVSWQPVRSTIDASEVTDRVISGWVNDANSPYSVDPGDYYWIGEFYASVGNNFLGGNMGTNPVKFRQGAPFATNGTHGHVGNYYNWSAAVAMNNSSTYVTSTVDDVSLNPQNSICPAGWRLPTISTQGGSYSNFETIGSIYNPDPVNDEKDRLLIAAPLFFVRSGTVSDIGYGPLQYNAGEYGNYWSSTVTSATNARNMTISSSSNHYSGSLERRVGLNVRCIAR